MTLALAIALAWVVALVVVVSLCRIASVSDRAVHRQLRDRWAARKSTPSPPRA